MRPLISLFLPPPSPMCVQQKCNPNVVIDDYSNEPNLPFGNLVDDAVEKPKDLIACGPGPKFRRKGAIAM